MHYRWQVVLMLWAICFFNYADRQAIFSVFPLLESEMHLSPLQLGLLGSAFAWTYGLGAPFAGHLVDRMRRKSAILTGLNVWSAICAATALSDNFRHLLFFRAAEGLGETIYYPAAVSMISDYHGRATRSRALGLLVTSIYFGTIAGGFFAGHIGQHYGWRWSFIVFGALGIVLGLVLRRMLVEPVRGAADSEQPTPVREATLGEAARLIFGSPAVLTLMAAFVCAKFVAVVLLAWMPKFLHDRFGMGLAAAGLNATLYAQLASMAGAFAGGWMADALRARTKAGRILVQAAGTFGGAPFVVLCGVSSSLGTAVVALTAWGFFKGLYDANIFASAFDVVPAEARGATVGVMNCIGWLAGRGTAPVVVGALAGYWGLGPAIAATAAVYVVGGALLLLAGLFVRRVA